MLSVGLIVLAFALPWNDLFKEKIWLNNESVATDYRSTLLNPAQRLQQSVVADQEGLKGIRILVGAQSYELAGKYSFLDAQNQAPVLSGNFLIPSASNVLEVNFDSIAASKGQSFTVILEADASNAKPIILLQEDEKTASSGTQWVMALGYESSLSHLEFLKILSDRMSQYKPIWVKTPWLYGYFGAFAMAWIILMVAWVRELKFIPSDNPQSSTKDLDCSKDHVQ